MNALVNRLRVSLQDEFREILRCCTTFEMVHPSQSSLLKSAVMSIDPARLDAAAVVIIAKRPWAGELYKHLEQKLDPKSPAIKTLKKELEK